jgi:hypothetical protein
MPGGRPTKYKKEMCKQLIDIMSKGHSLTAACAQLGITRDTAWRWSKDKQEFSDALEHARQLCIVWWEKLGMMGATGKLPGFNSHTFQWMTKNICSWRDRIDQQVSGPDGGPMQVECIVSDYCDDADPTED